MYPLVAVTGHTSGLGKSIFDFYTKIGYNTVGFSSSNGFDLRDWTTMQQFLDKIVLFDLVISNAKPDFFQAVFLYEFARRNKFNTKIVSIGSQIVGHNIDTGADIGINLYKTQKLALQNAHQQLVDKFPKLKSILIHPAHLYDKDGTLYTDIESWVERLHVVVNNNHSVELYVD
jgi:hypothetical protein